VIQPPPKLTIDDPRVEDAKYIITARLKEHYYSGRDQRYYPLRWRGDFIDTVSVLAHDFDGDTATFLWTFRCESKSTVPEWLVAN
jgi:hypothetical protein